ncbi:MAG TPA: amino acid adenylation domain-containing protein [Nitrospiraceae bacterium]|nr:amino acid adenylation domain-containing protein [Nitrospiraceae bacterium]
MTIDHSVYPLSFGQERLWFLNRVAPDSPLYNLQIDIPLPFAVDESAWREAFAEIIRRHEALRTTFHAVDGQPVQFVSNSMEVPIPTVDLSPLPESERGPELERIADADSRQLFDLSTGPLLRGTLVRMQEAAYVFLLTMHHIVSDGWSMDVLAREIAVLYDAFADGRPSPLAELPIQYPEFAVLQRERLSGEKLDDQLQYWRKHLSGLPALDLPTDRPRPSLPSYRGGYLSADMPPPIIEGMRRLSQREGATLFMTLLAAFQTLMMRYTGQEDIVVGTPIANRSRPELEPLIGFFVNTLVMRTNLGGAPTFVEVVRRVRETALEAYSNQDLPFEKLVEELHPQRDLSRNPLFQVMFVLQNSIARAGDIAASPAYQACAAATGDIHYGTSKFDLTLYLAETDTGLSCIFEYSTDLFDDETIRRMAGHWFVLLQSILSNPDLPVSRLPILTAQERHKLLVEFNRSARQYPKDKTIKELFEEQAAAHARSVAVNSLQGEWSYAELNGRANRLAQVLRQLRVSPGQAVGISIPRSADQILAVLATIKAGGAYLPLDPAYPQARLLALAKDAGPNVIITRGDSREAADSLAKALQCAVVDVGEAAGDGSNLETVATPDSLAYILYTSGSTGKPKGVCVTQRNVVRLVRNTDYCEFGPTEKLLCFAPLQFDASTFEIWGALLNGACLEVFPPGMPSLEELGSFIERSGVTTVWLTAGLFHNMVESQLGSLWGVRQLLAGGDVLSPSHCQTVLDELPGCVVINGYGPTETTTFAACHRMKHGDRIEGPVPIGRPIANSELFILDRERQIVPTGVAGELYIGGEGVAQGYLNDVQLTNERFIPHPFAPNNSKRRLYKTGDRARYRADGTAEFLGRQDRQIKIRGFRVELGDIESTLRQHPLVGEACVLLRDETGEKQIIGYVTMPNGPSTTAAAQVRRYAQQQLPDYLVPAVIVPMASFPMTANGKIDRKALQAPVDTDWRPADNYAEPQSEVEQVIAAIWREVLQVERVGRHDNFFDLGGHSLLLVQVHSRLQEVLARSLSMVDLFRCPTVEALAVHLGSDGCMQSRPTEEVFEHLEDRAAKQRLARVRRGSRAAAHRGDPA